MAPAAKPDVDGRFDVGDAVGFAGDEVVAWGDPAETLTKTLRHLADGAEIVTLIDGEEPPIALDEVDLGLENGAVVSYNEAIRVSRDAGDNTSRELFEKLLKDEEGHVDWLEAQLHLISEIGYERYLSQQIEGSE